MAPNPYLINLPFRKSLNHRICRRLSIATAGLIAFSFFIASGSAASLAPVTKVIAATGDTPSRGAGKLDELDAPVLSSSGVAAFAADLRNDGFLVGYGVFRGGVSRTPDAIALQHDPTPDINGNLGAISDPALYINSRGQVAFIASLSGTLGGALDSSAIYRGDGGSGGLTQIMRANQSVPEGTGRFAILLPSIISMNNGGQVAFSAYLRSAPGGQADSQGVYRSDGTNLTKIARTGDSAPGDNGTFSSMISALAGPAINESGQVLFVGQVSLDSQRQILDGLFRGDGNAVVKIVIQGDAAPGGNGKFGSFALTKPAFNGKGEAAFAAALLNTDLGTADNAGIFRGNEGKLVQIARRGDLVPGNNGRFLDFVTSVALNNDGKVLFLATITGASSGPGGGIFIGDGNTLVPVAKLGDPAPGGGRFSSFNTTACGLNNSGQAVFYASLSADNGGTASSAFGLFFYDPVLGLYPVARQNEPLADIGPITSIEFEGGLDSEGSENSGFNDLGQVAYKCFAGGDAAIALWELKDVGNNLPPVSAGLHLVANQGQALQLTASNLLSVVSDPEGGALTLVSVAETSAKGGTVRRNGSQITYTPLFSFLGEDEFQYIVRDEAGLTTTALAQITVMAPDRAPYIQGSRVGGFSVTVQPKETLTISVADLLGVVTDPDGDPITLAPLGATTIRGASMSRDGDSITLQWDADALERAVAAGNDQFSYQAEDGRGGSVTVQAQILFASDLGFSGIQVKSNDVSFSLNAAAGTWRIERALSVNGPWTDVGSVLITVSRGRRGGSTGSAVFHDPNPPANAAFYRATSGLAK